MLRLNNFSAFLRLRDPFCLKLIGITDKNLVQSPTWSANISTVFIVNLLEQKLNKSSKLGPSKSNTRTL